MSAIRKTYLSNTPRDSASRYGASVRVPMREIVLSTGDSVVLYDTSGPYTDSALKTDVQVGLPKLRAPWIAARGAVATQLWYARRGEITAEMEFIALREGVSAELVRDEVAAGRAVIPANARHPEIEPMVIGEAFLVKVNANIGNSSVSSSIEQEVEKMPILEDIMNHEVLGPKLRLAQQEGELTILRKQIQKRFGPLSEATQKRLSSLSTSELEAIGERIFDARSVEDLLR